MIIILYDNQTIVADIEMQTIPLAGETNQLLDEHCSCAAQGGHELMIFTKLASIDTSVLTWLSLYMPTA